MNAQPLNPDVAAYADHPFWDSQLGQTIKFILVSYLVDSHKAHLTPRHKTDEYVMLIVKKRTTNTFQLLQKMRGGLEVITKYDCGKMDVMQNISKWFEKHSSNTFVDWTPLPPKATTPEPKKKTKLYLTPSTLNLRGLADMKELADELLTTPSPREERARANYPKQRV